jgi:hypothetical protein
LFPPHATAQPSSTRSNQRFTLGTFFMAWPPVNKNPS